LVGYTERPTELQLVVYMGTLVVMYLLMRLARYTPPRERQATA
jgi:high-affinity Fe2+/Pb2+ permease